MSVKLLCAVAASTALIACGGGGGGGGGSSSGGGSSVGGCTQLNSSTFNCTDSLNAIVDNAVVPTVASLQTALGVLNTATEAYCADNTDANLMSAKTAWQATMTQWQILEAMQFGPVAEQRSNFYTFPIVDNCRVDEAVEALTSDGTVSNNQVVTSRSLSALDYTLFESVDTRSCTGSLETPALKAWYEDISASERLADRCQYAEALVDNLIANAATLKTAVDGYEVPASGNPQAVANEISDALFYIDKQTKDAKLSSALPSNPNDNFDVNELEFAERNPYGLQAIAANLQGALLIMGSGMNNLLAAAGQGDLAVEMSSALQQASADALLVSENLHAVFTTANVNRESNVAACISTTSADVADDASDVVRVCALDDAIRGFTNPLKDRFVMTLSFSTPGAAQGDSD